MGYDVGLMHAKNNISFIDEDPLWDVFPKHNIDLAMSWGVEDAFPFILWLIFRNLYSIGGWYMFSYSMDHQG